VVALRAGLTTWWAEPIMGAAGRALGFMDVCRRQTGEPAAEAPARLLIAVQLAATAATAITHRATSSVFDLGGRGSRQHQGPSREPELALPAPLVTRAASGGTLTLTGIAQACRAQTGKHAAPSAIHRLLDRHGWQGGSAPVPSEGGRCGAGRLWKNAPSGARGSRAPN